MTVLCIILITMFMVLYYSYIFVITFVMYVKLCTFTGFVPDWKYTYWERGAYILMISALTRNTFNYWARSGDRNILRIGVVQRDSSALLIVTVYRTRCAQHFNLLGGPLSIRDHSIGLFNNS